MSRNKKILTILAIVFVVVGGGVGWLYYATQVAEKELNAVAEPIIRDMAASKWDGAVFDKYASPHLKKWLIENKYTQGMPGFAVLGNVREYKGIESFQETTKFALLAINVQFDNGPGHIQLGISKHDGQWLIDTLNVNSPAFFQKPTGDSHAK